MRQVKRVIIAALLAYGWHIYTEHNLQANFRNDCVIAGVQEDSTAARCAYSEIGKCIYLSHWCFNQTMESLDKSALSDADKVQATRLIWVILSDRPEKH